MNKTFSRDTRERIYKKYNWQCANYKHPKCKNKTGLSIHHIIHNTKMNERIYGEDKIQSEENGILLCEYCHTHFGQFNEMRKGLEERWKNE